MKIQSENAALAGDLRMAKTTKPISLEQSSAPWMHGLAGGSPLCAARRNDTGFSLGS